MLVFWCGNCYYDPMKKEIETIKKEISPILRDNGVSRSFVFGSYARNEATATSDLDLLLSFHEPKSLLDLVALQCALEDQLNMKVDIVTEDSLNPRLRSSVNQEKIRVL